MADLLLRKYGISKATFFKWRDKFGGASVSDVKRLFELRAESAQLKRVRGPGTREAAGATPPCLVCE